MSEERTNRDEVLDVLESWIVRVANKGQRATLGELTALPGVARVWLESTAPIKTIDLSRR